MKIIPEKPSVFKHNPNACSHQWIDPEVPPIERQAVAPYILEGNSKAMQIGKRYRCQRCSEEISLISLISYFSKREPVCEACHGHGCLDCMDDGGY